MRSLLFGKKRGSRRTGSRLAGRLWELGFYLALFALGCAGVMIVVGSLATRTWPATSYFQSFYLVETKGSVLEDRTISSLGDEIPRGRELLVEFEVDGETVKRWLFQAESHDLPLSGQPLRIWVDPSNPESATLLRPSWWGLWFTLAVLVSIAVLGASAVVRATLQLGVSHERRTAFVQKAADTTVLASGDPPVPTWPTVPAVSNLTDSPGVKLAYRLPVVGPPSWKLVASALLALACGGLATSFAVFSLQRFAGGGVPWVLLLFCLPLSLLAVWSIYHFLNEVIDATAVGATGLEVSALPMVPGKMYDVYLVQGTRQPTKSVAITAVCKEETTFMQGTDVRHDVQLVYRQQLHCEQTREHSTGDFIRVDCKFTPPVNAMHSFQGSHNVVRWQLIVELISTAGESWQRSFPLVVRPLSREEKAASGE